MFIPLKTCAVRSWKHEDTSSLARHANDRDVWLNLRDAFPHPYTEQDAVAWIAFASTARRETHFAIEVNGQAVGAIGFTIKEDIFRRSAEIGYWLGRDARGRGAAAEALGAMTSFAFQNFDLARLYATVIESNRRRAGPKRSRSWTRTPRTWSFAICTCRDWTASKSRSGSGAIPLSINCP